MPYSCIYTFLGALSKSLKYKLIKCTCEMHVNFLNLVFNFLQLRIKRCRCYYEEAFQVS